MRRPKNTFEWRELPDQLPGQIREDRKGKYHKGKERQSRKPNENGISVFRKNRSKCNREWGRQHRRGEVDGGAGKGSGKKRNSENKNRGFNTNKDRPRLSRGKRRG